MKKATKSKPPMRTHTGTKIIHCSNASCEKPFSVPKWAPKNQVCKECSNNENVAAEEAAMHPTVAPVDKLRSAQELLNRLGFIITSRGYSKQYQDGDAIVRLEPHWDQGTSLDRDYQLVGMMVTRQELVTVVDKDLNNKIPKVAHVDMTTIMQELDIRIPNSLSRQVHIDTVVCQKCQTATAEWVMLGDKFYCINCSPVKHKYG